MALTAKLAGALEEKTDHSGRWSSFRLVLMVMAAAWVVRFLSEPVTILMHGGTLTPLGKPMAGLGAAILLAGPLRVWMERTDPSAIPVGLAAIVGALVGRGSASAPDPAPYTPPATLVQDADRGPDEFEQDEP